MTGKNSDKVHVTSYNQSGGITAHTVNMAPPQREVDSRLVADLKANLAGQSAKLISIMGDNESWTFAERLADALRKEGVNAEHTEYRQAFGQQPPQLAFGKGDDKYDVSIWVGTNS